MRECVWTEKRQLGLATNPTAFKRSPYSAFFYDENITKSKILSGVFDGSFFGLLEVDISSPEEVKQRFKTINFPPIFDRVVVERAHLSQNMASKCDDANIKFPLRPQLSLAYSAKKYLITSETLKFYLEIGLEVTGWYAHYDKATFFV